MSFIDHTIFFPPGRLESSFVDTYLSRYTDPETGLASVHWDDVDLVTTLQPSPSESTPE